MSAVDLSAYGVIYGTDTANIANNNGALAACRSWLAAQLAAGNTLPKLTAQDGVVVYDQSQNWAIRNLTFEPQGEMHWRYYGTGDAITLDGSADPAGKVCNFNFGGAGQHIIEAPATAGNACYAQSLIRCKMNLRVRGAGANSAGIKTAGLVDTDINIVCSGDDNNGWYLGAKPLTGISMTSLGVADTQTSYCRVRASIDGVNIGAYMDGTLGVSFLQGYIQNCTSYGMQFTTNALNDKIYGLDLEENGSADVVCDGQFTTFRDVDSGSKSTTGGIIFTSGAQACELIGGNHDAITINAGATGTKVEGARYARGLGAATLIDNGNNSLIGENYDCLRKRWTRGVPAQFSLSPVGPNYAYSCNNARGEVLIVTTANSLGGIVLYRHGAAVTNLPLGQPIQLSYGDVAIFSFNGTAPVIVSLPR